MVFLLFPTGKQSESSFDGVNLDRREFLVDAGNFVSRLFSSSFSLFRVNEIKCTRITFILTQANLAAALRRAMHVKSATALAALTENPERIQKRRVTLRGDVIVLSISFGLIPG